MNGTSASASEIVAGALKNHDRAVIIGETTFGKGSVQLVFTDLPDKAALKLTIAQYLTEPGDVSIQGVGVTPDIELDPMTVDPLEMDLTVDTGRRQGARPVARACRTRAPRRARGRPRSVRYDLPSKDRLELRERGGDLDENFALDFPIQFARDFARRTCSRASALDAGAPGQGSSSRDTREAEVAKVADELRGDRASTGATRRPTCAAPPAPTPPPGVEVKVETDRPNNEVDGRRADEPQGHGDQQGDARRSTASSRCTKSDNPMFDNKELVIGKLEPGKIAHGDGAARLVRRQGPQGRLDGGARRRTRRAICQVPKDALMRADGVKLHFEEARGRAPADAETARDRASRSSGPSSRTPTRSSTTARATATAACRRARA